MTDTGPASMGNVFANVQVLEKVDEHTAVVQHMLRPPIGPVSWTMAPRQLVLQVRAQFAQSIVLDISCTL